MYLLYLHFLFLSAKRADKDRHKNALLRSTLILLFIGLLLLFIEGMELADTRPIC